MTQGSLKPILIGVGGGTLGSILANQVPQNQHQSHLADKVKHVKRKAKGKIKKSMLPISDDPNFNQAVAQKVYDLVMKMDDATAEMFCDMVVGDIYETTIEKNRIALQQHLDEVINERAQMVKKALVRVAKSADDADVLAYARAVDELTGVSKAVVNPYTSGRYHFEESDFRRDPRSGQFTMKVKHDQTKPLSNRVAEGMGIVPTDKDQRARYMNLSAEQKAHYQSEYRQLAQFLDMITNSTGVGDQEIHLRVRDKMGNEFRQPHVGTPDKANAMLLNPHQRLVAIEATPTTLTAGGAAFGLANALGAQPGQHTGERIGMSDRAIEGMPDFESQWSAQPENMKSSNAQLYSRVGASGKYLSQVAPKGSKPYMAAKLAEIVGSHGAEAESVIGPAARKTAYRYRGTEKTPNRLLAREYGAAINRSKSRGLEPEAEEWQAARPGGPPDVETRRRQPTKVKPGGGESTPLSLAQQAIARQTSERRAPTWAERAGGREVIRQYLKTKLPKGDLYSLQLASGVTPPSQGIMLNADGQIVSEAVGYGDDHYLPFNLKHLKDLKGGEYIRTRSVGGLTSEDIYTGLASGARRVTVVSRSGTFSVEFQPDFRGGRRHNDKARRMTRRYEQLLDAVQSNQVTRQPVPPQVEQAIRDEVASDMRGEKRPEIRAEVKRRIDDYRQDPEMGPEDEKIARFVYEQGMRDNPDRDQQEWLKAARDMVASGKRLNYKLDAEGYKAAQDALEEQFPYYIMSQPVIEREGERVSREPDKGYVEPGRNRPTEARAGLFGTKENQPGRGAVGSMKFSSSQANYQRGQIGRGPGDIRPGQLRPVGSEPEAKEGEARELTLPGKKKPSPAERAVQQAKVEDAAVELFNEFRKQPDRDVLATTAPVLREDPLDFMGSIGDPAKMEAFREQTSAVLDKNLETIARERPDLHTAYLKFKRESGAAGTVGYQEALAYTWTPTLMEFGGKPYERGASEEDKDLERKRIDDRTTSVVFGLPLSKLTDKQLQEELSARRHIHTVVTRNPQLLGEGNAEERGKVAAALLPSNYDRAAIIQLMNAPDERMERGAQDVHRMRWLNQGRPDSERGTQVREAEAPNELTTQVRTVVDTSQVKDRMDQLTEMRREDGDPEAHPVDEHLSMGNDMLDRIQSGSPPNAEEVRQFMDNTQHLAELVQLDDRERKLWYELGPGGRAQAFRKDPQGFWEYKGR